MRKALLLGAVLIAYGPAFRAGYVWDDDKQLGTGRTLAGIWSGRQTPQYYPLTFTSFWAEEHLWGGGPRVSHAVNVALHAANSVLVWQALEALGVPGAWVAGAVFGLHPVHVESAAWVSERKNLLSAFFELLALMVFLRWRTEPARRGSYALSLVLFAAALTSKTVACSLPVVLLILLWWKEGRVPESKDWLRLAPFFALGAAFALVTVWVETHRIGASGPEWQMGFMSRFLVACRAPWFYLGKLLWPSGLSFVYPRWEADASMWLYPAAWAGVFLFFKRDRGVMACLSYFLVTLTPALGFINVYPHRYSFVADHFQYTASLGPITLFGARLGRFASEADVRKRLGLRLAGLALLVPLAVLTWQRCTAFQGPEALWKDTLARNPGAWLAHNNLGVIRISQERLDSALDHLRQAYSLHPDGPEIPNNLAAALRLSGRFEEASSYVEESLRSDPGFVPARLNRALILEAGGHREEAVREYERVLEEKPDSVVAQEGLKKLRKDTSK